MNGNLNETQNHYIEGQSIPYRAILNRLKTGCETKLRIGFDVIIDEAVGQGRIVLPAMNVGSHAGVIDIGIAALFHAEQRVAG